MMKSVYLTYLVWRVSFPCWRWTLINDDVSPPSAIAQPLQLQEKHLRLILRCAAILDPQLGSGLAHLQTFYYPLAHLHVFPVTPS